MAYDSKEYYWKNREVCLARTRLWREKNKEKIKEYNNKYKSEHKEEIKKSRSLYWEKNKEEIQKKHKAWVERNKGAVRATERAWRKGYRRKTGEASTLVFRAIKCKKIIKNKCEVCGSLNAEAHHDDYNKPLEARWLCREHHLAWHKQNKPKYIGEK